MYVSSFMDSFSNIDNMLIRLVQQSTIISPLTFSHMSKLHLINILELIYVDKAKRKLKMPRKNFCYLQVESEKFILR